MGNAKSRQVAERALAAERAAAALLTPERALVVLGVVGCGTLVHFGSRSLDSSPKLLVRVGATFALTYHAYGHLAAELKRALGLDGLGDLDAFGPLWTLSGLLFSVMLGQTYQYYFDRQGAIQDAAFEEALALWRLSQLVTRSVLDLHARRTAFLLIKKYAERLLENGLSDEAALVVEFDLGRDEPSQLGDIGGLADATDEPGASAVRALHNTIRDVHRCAAKRVSNINADLPALQWHTLGALATLLIASFLVLDLGHAKMEAAVFACVLASSNLFYLVLNDLSNPFHGSWSVSPASDAINKVVREMLAKHAALVKEHSRRAAKQVRNSIRLAPSPKGTRDDEGM